MRFGEYFRENLRRSFAVWDEGQRVGALLSLLVAFGLAAVLSLFGYAVEFTSTWGQFWGGLATLWFIFLVLVITPYKMFADSSARIADLEAERKGAALRLAELRHEGVRVRNRGNVEFQDADARAEWCKAAESWRDEIVAAIRGLSDAEAEWFRILDVVPPPRVPCQITDPGHLKMWRELDYRLSRLDGLIQKRLGA